MLVATPMMKSGAAAGLCFVLAASALSQKVTLKFLPPVGKSYSYTMSNDIKASGGAGMAMGQTMNVSVSMLSRNAKGTNVRMKIVDVKMKAPAGSPGAGNMSQVEKQLKGSTTELIYDSRARMVGTPKSSSPQMSQMMGQMGAMGAGFMGIEFPAGPVGKGTKWSASIDIGKIMGSTMPGMMRAGKNSKIPVTYVVSKIEKKGGKNLATVAVTVGGKVDMSMGGGQNAQRMNMEMTMNMKGNIVVDAATGLPTSGNSKGTVAVSLNGRNAMNQNVTTAFRLK